MAELITAADYDTIRKVIDTTINDKMLPGDVIGLSIYEAAAIQDVLQRDPDAATRTDEALNRVRRAAVYFCAARLAPSLTGIMLSSLSVQARDLSYSRPPFDGRKRALELLALAEAEIAEVLTPDEAAPARPTMFTVASGTRGK